MRDTVAYLSRPAGARIADAFNSTLEDTRPTTAPLPSPGVHDLLSDWEIFAPPSGRPLGGPLADQYLEY